MIALPTPHFLLRPLAECDEQLYCALYTDAEVMQHIGPPQDPASARRDFQATVARLREAGTSRHFWVLVEPGESQGCGLIGIAVDRQGAADLGIVMHARVQGRSYAAYAIAAVSDHAFLQLGIRLIRTRHTTRNVRTEGLMHKLGFLPMACPGNSTDLRWQLTPGHWATQRGSWRPA